MKIDFVYYKSSKLEIEWLKILKNHENDYSNNYCTILKMYNRRLIFLQDKILECKNPFKKKCEGVDLSYFIYKYQNGTKIKEYIEPLFGILRNTFSFCNEGSKGDISIKDYLLPSYILALTKPIVYIDAGASDYFVKDGGSSQKFFYDFYMKYRNVKFKKWLLWEKSKKNLSKLIKTIPNNIKNIYNYYNTPIDSDINSKNNPLTYVKQYQNKAYVIFKIDVDNNKVEIPILNYLLKYDDIIPNEFYFEYHFLTPFMKRWWNVKHVDTNCSLYCATKKFLNLRKKGIRSHGWV